MFNLTKQPNSHKICFCFAKYVTQPWTEKQINFGGIKLANIKSAAKRARQSLKRHEHNRYYRTTARTFIKKARTQIEGNDLEAAEATVQQAIKALDKAAQKGVIHRNNAARRKSRLTKALNKAKAETAA